MFILLLRTTPSLLPRIALRSTTPSISTIHVTSPVLQCLKPQLASPLSTWRGTVTSSGIRPNSIPITQFFRSKTQQVLLLRRQYAIFKKGDLVPRDKVKGGALAKPERLLDRLKARGSISDLQAPPVMTHTQRLLGSFLFTVTVCVLSYAYAQYWAPPPRDTRLFPNIPQSAATIAGIILANVTIFLLWKVPIPINWRILNKYFISVPGLPNAFSVLGCAFSHQSFPHLALNCFALYVFGSTLCDQIGRGNFLGIYFSSAVISSFASLAYHVFGGRFHVFALGASGAVSGIVGAFAYLNPNSELYLLFFPFMAIKAAHFVGAVAGLEVWGLVRGYTKVDHVAHLSGLAAGVASGYGMWHAAKRRGERRIKRWTGERV